VSLQTMLLHGAIKAITYTHPELKNVLDAVMKYEPQIAKLAPVLQAGIKEGPGAFAAAKEHAPDLAAAIGDFVRSIPRTAATQGEGLAAIDLHAENFTRELVGAGAMDTDEERKWMDGATAHLSDSRLGSG
jgi:hypothetical protein